MALERLFDLVDRVIDLVDGDKPPSYLYAHEHTYTVDGGTLTLAPIAVLLVDDDNPFPSNQGLNFVQIAEIAEVGLDLVANLVVALTNLVDVGAVGPTASPGADDGARDTIVSGMKALLTHRDELHELSSTARRAHAVGTGAATSFKLTLTLKKLVDELVAFVLKLIAAAANLYGEARELRQYADQFQSIVVPESMSTGVTDAAFGRMRVAGPNPMVIARVKDAVPDKLGVTDAGYQGVMGADDSLADAIAEKRLYIADYQALDALESGTFPVQKYASAPIALFAVARDASDGALTPVAIQLGQAPGPRFPVFYADGGDAWELAKLHVQSADANHHELISHLGLTHLLVEPFVVSAHRKLPQDHPVFVLLLPHFQGTLFINNAAITSLINPGGVVDRILNGTIQSDWAVTADALGALDFSAWSLPLELEGRGLEDHALPLAYPYRDDAMDLWGAITAWVRSYVDIYYADDQAVADDSALQAWIGDVSTEGRLNGVGVELPGGGRGVTTVQGLVDIVTTVMFTASVQHAAVNFPQRTIMSYTPVMPTAVYSAPPTSHAVADRTLETLPPLQQALLQLLTLQGLGGVYFTRLGDYDRHQRGQYFTDARVQGPMEDFRAALDDIERAIGDRNQRREAYTPLLPSQIPQSINI